jgi:cytoskeletal protein CcmA (bactofilin family)
MRRKSGKRKKGKNFSLDTIIGANTVFEGSIQSECSVCVEGKIKGRIEAKGEVVIGREGEVEADIYADRVIVGGQIIGNIHALSRLEITATGRVRGDIEATKITVAEGGLVDGMFKMMDETESAYPRIESKLSVKKGNKSEIQSLPNPVKSPPQA